MSFFPDLALLFFNLRPSLRKDGLYLDKRWSLETETYKPHVVYVIAIIVLTSLVLWLAAMLFVYLADDWSSPAADERSIPAARTY